jgi:hypothetical protein
MGLIECSLDRGLIANIALNGQRRSTDPFGDTLCAFEIMKIAEGDRRTRMRQRRRARRADA